MGDVPRAFPAMIPPMGGQKPLYLLCITPVSAMQQIHIREIKDDDYRKVLEAEICKADIAWLS